MHADSMVAQAARFLFAFLISACAASAQFPWRDGSWKDKERIGDEARFLSPGEIQRYHLKNKAWLPSVSLPRTGATAMATDDDGMVVAYGTTIYRYGADFSEQTALATVSS